MSSNEISSIPLEEIKVQKHNVRTHDIDVGIDDLASSIKTNGLLQPITAYKNSETGQYVILAGQRRLNAYHYLNEKHPGEGFDKIKCIIIDEPNSNEKKLSLSLAENITQLPMHNSDRVKAVTDLYNTYHNYDMVRKEFGLTPYMVDKYVKFARLPEELKDAINNGEISPNPKTAENAALQAVDSLQYTKGVDIPIQDVLAFAKEYAHSGSDKTALVDSASKGGSIEDITKRAQNKVSTKQTINLSSDVAEKLHKIAEASGETEKDRATWYVVHGVDKDYRELDN